jgi:hypothetical protein
MHLRFVRFQQQNASAHPKIDAFYSQSPCFVGFFSLVGGWVDG